MLLLRTATGLDPSAFTVRVPWPEHSAIESVRGEACEDEPDAGLDMARGTWSLTCKAPGGSGVLATVTSRGPRDLAPSLAVAQAEAVDAEMRALPAPALVAP